MNSQHHSGSVQLILGGARSGKSGLAENRARESGHSLVYIATGTAGDGEMAARIQHHQARRGPEWQLIETPLLLADCLAIESAKGRCVVVDCLTLWISNCLHKGCWPEERGKLLKCITHIKGQVILVSNEVGSGVVPLGELSREFVDASGFLHQQLAQVCETVTLVVAGLPLELKNIATKQ